MNITITSLTRFGDLLQMQPVISGLAEQGHRVAAVCLSNFADTAELLSDLDQLCPLPGGKLLAELERHWPSALGELLSFASSCPKADRILNLTPTLPGRLLSRLLTGDNQTAELAGFCLDELGFGFSSSPWAVFLLSAVSNRGCSPFNIVDLFRRAAGLEPDPAHGLKLSEPKQEDMRWAEDFLRANSPPDAACWLAMQLGASEDRRRWPIDCFARLGEMLWREKKICPVLLGSAQEEALGREFLARSKTPAVNMIGRTSLGRLAAALRRTRGLITNDTGTMHLAAALKLPIAAIFLATAQPWDTGPYLAGSLCLEPDMDCHPCPFGRPCSNNEACRRAVSPETVFELLRPMLAGENPPNGPYQAKVWESVIGADGYMDLRSLSGHENSDRTAWIRHQKFFFRHFLDAKKIVPAEAAHLPALSRPAYEEINHSLEQAAQLLTMLKAQGAMLAATPNELLKNKFMSGWRKVGQLWQNSVHFTNMGFLWLSFSQEAGGHLAGIMAQIERFSELSADWRDSLKFR